MDSESIYTRNTDFIFRKVVDEFVLVPIHQNVADMNCLYTLNGIGAFIWESLETPTTFGQMEEKILTEYNSEVQVVRRDLENFLQEMVSIDAVRKV